MTSLWSEFIKYGNPGGGWNPVGQESKQFLDFNLKPRMESRSDHYEERMEFWKSIYYWNFAYLNDISLFASYF